MGVWDGPFHARVTNGSFLICIPRFFSSLYGLYTPVHLAVQQCMNASRSGGTQHSALGKARIYAPRREVFFDAEVSFLTQVSNWGAQSQLPVSTLDLR